ncbi:MAG: alpha-N-arabinofuranosidase [Firmicutes bacterium]|nr:alpha-N-arabinofuranosidase [Bacillota bacterium]
MNRLIINGDRKKGKINRNIYGHFAEHLGRCIYEGFWVGEESPIPNTRGIREDVVAALRKIKVPVLRWPGGCFAEHYHWQDGIGPRAKRKKTVNVYWGGVTENNHFGTHEFMDLCEQLEAEPYICGNVGSGSVHEMEQWIEYMTFDGESPLTLLRKENGREKPWKLRYFGIGNESWGCGGNMRPEYYADLYRQYQTFVKSYGENKIFKIASGSHDDDYYWTEVLMEKAGKFMDGLSLHYYTVSGDCWQNKGSATEFGIEEYFRCLQKALLMDDLLTKHSAIMDKYDPEKRVALIVDEWGAWHQVEPGTNPRFLYQQNTIRDALIAGITLNIFNRHCDRVQMANLAQIVNVLQALILTRGEEMILTPTYHVFDLYQVHQDADLLDFQLDCGDYELDGKKIPLLSAAVSQDGAGRVNVTLCNLHATDQVSLEGCFNSTGLRPERVEGMVLTADQVNAHNTFEEPDRVKLAAFNGVKLSGADFTLTLPAASVLRLSFVCAKQGER